MFLRKDEFKNHYRVYFSAYREKETFNGTLSIFFFHSLNIFILVLVYIVWSDT